MFFDEVLPFQFQPDYTPDSDFPFYFGIVDNASAFVEELRQKYIENEVYDTSGERVWLESTVPDGTPIAPKAATGPRQYARKKIFPYNYTSIEVWEWCVSGKGDPSRRNGRNERKNQNVSDSFLIPQPKRKSPGWDGCREFIWKQPTARSDLSSVYIDIYNSFVIYGGLGTPSFVDSSTDETPNAIVMKDMWVFNLNNCIHNCSNHGSCINGFCRCDPGFYGIDCSNITCPGSVCLYDEIQNEQHCTHCCHDGYLHKQDSEYAYIHNADGSVRKRSCSAIPRNNLLSFMSVPIDFTGQSNGICDGFGTCQCDSPYIGADCSMRDCKLSNCSGNGYCNAEYPVSRCACKPGYFGDSCEFIECLNNCTNEANGICDYTTGHCSCKKLYEPKTAGTNSYGSSWGRWEGEDCSFLLVWSAAAITIPSTNKILLTLFHSALLLLHYFS